MATYNGEKYIKEQISSILHQLNKKDELIISDDGSKDNTEMIIQSFNDNRIVYTKNIGKHGFVYNFENALKRAKGDYIFLSDQDDIWMNNKISESLHYLQDNDMIIHNADVIDAKGNYKGYDYFSTLHNHEGFWWNLYKVRCLGCCMAFKRNVLNACLPFPKRIVGHDYWIGMYAIAFFKVKYVKTPLLKYRRHGNNVSPSSEKSNTSFFYKVFTKRFSILWALIARRFFQH